MTRTRSNLVSLVLLGLAAAGCSSPLFNRGGDQGGDDAGDGGSPVEELAVTDAVDLETNEPTGLRDAPFPVTTRELFACIRVRPGSPRATYRVVWAREGAPEPLATTRLRVGRLPWSITAFEPLGLLEPGAYRAQVMAGDQVVAEASFEVESTRGAVAPARPGVLSISRLVFVRELDADRRPAGPEVTALPPGTRQVHCVFTVSAPTRASVVARWVRGGNIVLTNYLGEVEGDREWVITLEDNRGLPPGLYRVEVTAGEALARSGTFTVEEQRPDGAFGPAVSNLTLTSAVESATGRPAAPPLTTIRGDEAVIYLSMTFARMPPDSLLIVRWYEDATPAQPFATSTFRVSDRGSLAASLQPGDPLRAGPYHVDAVVAGRTLATLRFEVEPAQAEAPDASP